jgi:hypothetical protein
VNVLVQPRHFYETWDAQHAVLAENKKQGPRSERGPDNENREIRSVCSKLPAVTPIKHTRALFCESLAKCCGVCIRRCEETDCDHAPHPCRQVYRNHIKHIVDANISKKAARADVANRRPSSDGKSAELVNQPTGRADTH